MKQIEVSREFLEEFMYVKNIHKTLFSALHDVRSSGEYPEMEKELFHFDYVVRNCSQFKFAEVWAGHAEYVAKGQLYYVNLPSVGYLSKQGIIAYKNHAKVFTEQEIKDICPAYWNKAFLEPVEGK